LAGPRGRFGKTKTSCLEGNASEKRGPTTTLFPEYRLEGAQPRRRAPRRTRRAARARSPPRAKRPALRDSLLREDHARRSESKRYNLVRSPGEEEKKAGGAPAVPAAPAASVPDAAAAAVSALVNAAAVGSLAAVATSPSASPAPAPVPARVANARAPVTFARAASARSVRATRAGTPTAQRKGRARGAPRRAARAQRRQGARRVLSRRTVALRVHAAASQACVDAKTGRKTSSRLIPTLSLSAAKRFWRSPDIFAFASDARAFAAFGVFNGCEKGASTTPACLDF
jgi:hypothetical protein